MLECVGLCVCVCFTVWLVVFEFVFRFHLFYLSVWTFFCAHVCFLLFIRVFCLWGPCVSECVLCIDVGVDV